MSEVEATANLAEGPSPAEVAIEALDAALRERFGSAPSGAIGERRQRHESPEWDVAPHAIAEVCAWLKAEHGLNNLALLSTVDRLTHLDLVYLLDAMPVPPPYTRLWLRCRLERDVELPTIPTVCGVWRSANWQEREAFDLMGIRFEGHPDLRRILLPDCWEGYPLRKDYRYDSNTMVDAILTAELGPGEYRRPQGG